MSHKWMEVSFRIQETKSLQCQQVKWDDLPAAHWGSCTWRTASSCRLSSRRKILTCWRESMRGWESWNSAWRREGSRGSYQCVCLKHLNRGIEDEGAKLFSEAPSDRRRGSGDNLIHMKFHLSTRKHLFFHSQGSQTVEQIAQRGCSLHPWRYSKPDWAQSWSACSSWSYFNRVEDPKRFLPT